MNMKCAATSDPDDVFIVGGSTGIGREIANILVARGAHVTISARRQETLDVAQSELLAERRDESQRVDTVACDMAIAFNAHSIFSSLPHIPNTLYCLAGGIPTEGGFLVDLESETIERCMANNYYTSLYPAQAILKRWTDDDQTADVPGKPRVRRIIFMNSTASLVPIPGSIAYTAAKAAQRALADTMRLEVMRYSGPKSLYVVQCVFAHNFITPSLLEELEHKPGLTKRIEETDGDLADLEKRFPYPQQIARDVVAAVERSHDFAVMDRQLVPQLLWANMIGSSPKRGWGIFDSIMAFLASFIVFPFVRRDIERQCREDNVYR